MSSQLLSIMSHGTISIKHAPGKGFSEQLSMISFYFIGLELQYFYMCQFFVSEIRLHYLKLPFSAPANLILHNNISIIVVCVYVSRLNYATLGVD
jgi:hypothetical protein